MTRKSIQNVLPVAVCFVAAMAIHPAVAAPAKVVEVEVKNLAGNRVDQVPVTFGQVFRPGDIPRTPGIWLGDRELPVQADIKNRHPDGSAKFAVLTVLLPALPADAVHKLVLAPSAKSPERGQAVSLSDLLRTDFDAEVSFRFPDGAVRSVNARKLLEPAGGKVDTWLQGPLVTEWLVSGPPVDREGKPDDDLEVQFHVRAYAGTRHVRVTVVVENCWDTWAGNIRYDTTVTVGGKTVFETKAVDHRPLSRWKKVFDWGQASPPVHVTHDLAYLSITGALPNYDTSIPPAEPDWQLRRDLPRQGPDWEIMGKGSLTAYMPTTGGRPEIAPYPVWTVRYLIHEEPSLRDLVLANGDLAGSWPIHVRARATKKVMTINDRPEFWLDGRGQDKPAWKPDRQAPAPNHVKLTPDLAHQGSFAYVPYLLTGDYYYLEEAFFWANYCLLAT